MMNRFVEMRADQVLSQRIRLQAKNAASSVSTQMVSGPCLGRRRVFSILAHLSRRPISIAAVRSAIFAWGFLVLFCTGCASAEKYRSAEGEFQNFQIGALDDFDQQWIEQRGYKLHELEGGYCVFDETASEQLDMRIRTRGAVFRGFRVQGKVLQNGHQVRSVDGSAPPWSRAHSSQRHCNSIVEL